MQPGTWDAPGVSSTVESPRQRGGTMRTTAWIQRAMLVGCGLLLGIAVDRAWPDGLLPGASAQERRAPPPLTMESLPAEVAQLKALVPSNSHIMMDVQFHWTNLWFAGQKRTGRSRSTFSTRRAGHIRWLIRSRRPRAGPTARMSISRASSTASTPAVSPPSRPRSRRRTPCSSQLPTRRCSRAVMRATRAPVGRICVPWSRSRPRSRWSTTIREPPGRSSGMSRAGA